MKIIIFSDSHGDVDTMCGVVEKENPDMIIHLGDSIIDANQLNDKFPGVKMIKVLGGIDSQKENENWIQYVDIYGKRLMLTHGHTFIDDEKTKTNFEGITNMFLSDRNNADIILFGHTHEPFILCSDGKWIMNPGCICQVPSCIPGHKVIDATYGILTINKIGVLQWQFVEMGN